MANFTKQAIKAAFLELLDEKPLNKISVRDIVERCGINRNSFYYHFQDIPSLLGEIIVERTNELMAQYPTVDRIEEAFRASIDYAQKNRRAIMHVYNSVSRDTFEASVMRLCAYMTEQYLKSAYPDTGISDADRELLHRFIKCQLFGLCIDWMLGGIAAIQRELERVYKGESSFDVTQLMFVPDEAEEEKDVNRLLIALMNDLLRTITNVCVFNRTGVGVA